MKNRILFLVLPLSVLLLSGCISFFGNGVYSESKPLAQIENPVILIPGITRTGLKNTKTGKVVWGNTRGLYQWREKDDLALPIDSTNLREDRDDLVPYNLMKKIRVIPFFVELYTHDQFIKNMQKKGYQLGDMEHPKAGDNFFIFLYDWRRDNTEQAARLSQQIENIKKVNQNPDLKFDIVTHSNSNFLVRYYALYGGQDVVDQAHPQPTYEGAENIRKLIFVGAPYRGTMMAFQVLNEGFHAVPLFFVRKFSVYENFTMPSLYQLMPSPGEPALVDEKGKDLSVDIYDAGNWVKYRWSVFSDKEQKKLKKQLRKKYPETWQQEFEKENQKRMAYLEAVLNRARNFHRAIDESKFPLAEPMEFNSIVLTWGPTLAKAQLSPNPGELSFGGESKSYLYAEGDLMVTRASMEGQHKVKPQEFVLRRKHRGMVNNKDLHQQIFKILEN